MDDYKTHIGGKHGSKFNYQIKKINNSWVVVVHVLASVHTKLPLHLHVARIKEDSIDAIRMGLVDHSQCADIKFLADSEIVLFLDRGYGKNGTAVTLAKNGVGVFGPICARGKLNFAEIYDDGEEPPSVNSRNGQIAWKRQGHDCAVGGRQDIGNRTTRHAVATRKYNRSVVIYDSGKLFKLGDYVYRLGPAVPRVLLEPPKLAGLGDAIQAAFRDHCSGAVEVTEGQNTCRAWSALRRHGVSASAFSSLHQVIATRAAAEYGDFKDLHGRRLEAYEAAYKLYFRVVGKDAVDRDDVLQTMNVVHKLPALKKLWKEHCTGRRVPSTKNDVVLGLLQSESFDHKQHLAEVFDAGDGMTEEDVANRLVKSWYPKRVKDAASKNMKIGTMNEVCVMGWLAEFLNDETVATELAFIVEVVCIETRGLQVGGKDPLAKCSVDGVMAFLAHDLSRAVAPWTSGVTVNVCDVEVKSRTVQKTIELRKKVVVNNEGLRVFSVDLRDETGTSKFHELVLLQANRAQILFIASFSAGAEKAGNARTVCFVEATVHQIVYVVFVSVPWELRRATLVGVLRPTIDRFVTPVVDALKAVRRPADSKVLSEFCVDPDVLSDEHAYALDFALAEALRKLHQDGWNGHADTAGQPLPVMLKLVHKSVELWNKCMNSVDIVSQFVERLTRAHTNSTLPMQIWLLCLGVLVAWAHKFYAMMRAAGTGGGALGDRRQFEGATQFRKHCNKQSTMLEDLREIMAVVVEVVVAEAPAPDVGVKGAGHAGKCVFVRSDPDFWNTRTGVEIRSVHLVSWQNPPFAFAFQSPNTLSCPAPLHSTLPPLHPTPLHSALLHSIDDLLCSTPL